MFGGIKLCATKLSGSPGGGVHVGYRSKKKNIHLILEELNHIFSIFFYNYISFIYKS